MKFLFVFLIVYPFTQCICVFRFCLVLFLFCTVFVFVCKIFMTRRNLNGVQYVHLFLVWLLFISMYFGWMIILSTRFWQRWKWEWLFPRSTQLTSVWQFNLLNPEHEILYIEHPNGSSNKVSKLDCRSLVVYILCNCNL